MIIAKVMDIREGISEKKTFKNGIELNEYLNNNPFVIVRHKEYIPEEAEK